MERNLELVDGDSSDAVVSRDGQMELPDGAERQMDLEEPEEARLSWNHPKSYVGTAARMEKGDVLGKTP